MLTGPATITKSLDNRKLKCKDICPAAYSKKKTSRAKINGIPTTEHRSMMEKKMSKAAAIIPARYESKRLPGKPILPVVKKVTGKYLIQHVYENVRAAESIEDVIVATDDERICKVVEGFGGKVCMTANSHCCGTERIAEAAADITAPIIVNVQGDEPQIAPEQIDDVVRLLRSDPEAKMGTLAYPIDRNEKWNDPNSVKVVVNRQGHAIYFSRSPIPYVRDSENWIEDTPCQPLCHVGIYSYQRDFLIEYAKMPRCKLELAEKLEQLRAINAGYKIKVGITRKAPRGIDTQYDLEEWLSQYK
jgi:3-deoxy-manno-octulosonate cytidylyltransferase (CMP-KDO synthetase)